MTEEYMIFGTGWAAGVLSMAVWHGVHVFLEKRTHKYPYDSQLKEWAKQSEESIMDNQGKYTIQGASSTACDDQ